MSISRTKSCWNNKTCGYCFQHEFLLWTFCYHLTKTYLQPASSFSPYLKHDFYSLFPIILLTVVAISMAEWGVSPWYFCQWRNPMVDFGANKKMSWLLGTTRGCMDENWIDISHWTNSFVMPWVHKFLEHLSRPRQKMS